MLVSLVRFISVSILRVEEHTENSVLKLTTSLRDLDVQQQIRVKHHSTGDNNHNTSSRVIFHKVKKENLDFLLSSLVDKLYSIW